MALYIYQGFARDGKKMSGSIDASSESQVKEMLARQNIFPTSIILAHKVTRSEGFFKRLFSKKVSFKDKILFTKQLQVLLRSGIPLLEAIDLLDEQFKEPLHSILVEIKDGIKEGFSFADGLKRYPHVFENIYVQLVRAGEASGKLEILLERLVNYLEEQEILQKRIAAATRGPFRDLAIIVCVVIFLVTTVIPKLMGMFASQGASLPLPTKILMVLSGFVLNHYIILLSGVATIVLSFLYWKSTSRGAYMYDAFLLKLPIVSFFARMNAVVQFSSTLGMLLDAGVRLSEALDIVCDVVHNKVLKNTLLEAREKIIKQGKITQYLKQTKMFPSIAIYMLSTGEESGNLDTMLLEVARNYKVDLNEKADSLTEALNPIMKFTLAFIVGFVALAIAMPLSQMGKIAGI